MTVFWLAYCKITMLGNHQHLFSTHLLHVDDDGLKPEAFFLGMHLNTEAMKYFQNSRRMQKDEEDTMSEMPSIQNSGAISESRETKRSRRSLRALEKQATDLYSFLSELEVQKSAGPEKLKEFLDSTEEKPAKITKSPTTRAKNSVSPSNVSKSKLSPNRSPNNQPGISKRSEAASPTPPVRKDSVKRLENARSKYLSKSPKQATSELEAIQDDNTSSQPNEKIVAQNLPALSNETDIISTKDEANEKQNDVKTTDTINSEKNFDVESPQATKSPNTQSDSQKARKKAILPSVEKCHTSAKPSEQRRTAATSPEKHRSTTKPSEMHHKAAEPSQSSTLKSIETSKEAPTRTRARRREKPRDSTVKNLNEKMSETPKPRSTETAPKVSSIDDRLKSYQSRATRQDSTKKSVAAKPTSGDLVNRLSMWESGKVTAGGKGAKKNVDTSVVKQSQGVSSRKNMWETGAVSGSAEKKAVRAGEPHGANLASRKNLWLKATQEPAEKSHSSKPEDKGAIKVGVSSRLDKWEKGELKTASDKPKAKDTGVVASDVTSRRSKWETKAKEPSTRSTRKGRPEITHSTDLAARKNKYESKTEQAAATTRETARKSVSSQSDTNQRDSDLESL